MTLKRPIASSRARKSAAIMASAARLVALRGVASTTLQRISRDCGVFERTVIYLFGSKEGLLREVCQQHMVTLLAAVEQADRPEESHRRRLDALALALVQTIAGQLAAHKTMLISQEQLSLSDRQDLYQQQRWMVALFAEALEAVVPAVRDRPDLSKPAVLSLLAMLNQHAVWFRDTGPMRRATYARFTVNAVLAAVRQDLRRPPATQT